jgi:uncharacterized membrane protein YgcG
MGTTAAAIAKGFVNLTKTKIPAWGALAATGGYGAVLAELGASAAANLLETAAGQVLGVSPAEVPKKLSATELASYDTMRRFLEFGATYTGSDKTPSSDLLLKAQKDGLALEEDGVNFNSLFSTKGDGSGFTPGFMDDTDVGGGGGGGSSGGGSGATLDLASLASLADAMEIASTVFRVSFEEVPRMAAALNKVLSQSPANLELVVRIRR